MVALISADLFEALGLNGWSILFYLLNLVILVGGLFLLLYKPVKKMIKEKRETLENTLKENDELKSEAEKNREEYAKMLADLKSENAKVSAEVAKAAQQRADTVIAEAQQQAKAIIESAKKDALYQKEQLKNEYRASVNSLAVRIAQKLLEREISEKDNADLIEQVLSDWEE